MKSHFVEMPLQIPIIDNSRKRELRRKPEAETHSEENQTSFVAELVTKKNQRFG